MNNSSWEIPFFLILLGGVTLLVGSDPVVQRVRHLPALASPNFENGDVLLLSSLARLRTTVEKLLCATPITHVGVVWVDAGGTPFLLHTLRTPGAHLVPLRPWLKRNLPTNQVFVRRVVGGTPGGAALEAALQPLLGVHYSFGFWKAVVETWAPGLELPHPSHPDDRFCSELVADVLSRVGVLTFTTTSPHLILPRDFWDTSRLPFTPGYALAPPEEVLVLTSGHHQPLP